MGVLPINGRRGGRKEEFNPFAKDASQQHRRRRDERERQNPRRPTPAPAEPTAPPTQDIKADLERKQRRAIEKLDQEGRVAAPAVEPVPVPAEQPPEAEDVGPAIQSHEDRIAELRRKSEATKQNASRIEAAPDLSAAQTLESDVSPEVVQTEGSTSSVNAVNKTITKQTAPAVKDVFATIETKIEPKKDRRRRRRFDKKGGGRQKPERKLNRQKYLEYKYAAKDILDNPNIPEEHRSNVLGQIWAKGERQGIEECLEFIESKQAELILPAEVGDKLRDLVKRMTTKR
jgi:hypothetical protein